MAFQRLRKSSSGTKSVVGQSSIWSPTKFSVRQYSLVLLGLLVVAGGILLFAASSTPFASINADQGTLANGATVASDSQASDGKYVKFPAASGGGGGGGTTANCTQTLSPGASVTNAVNSASPGAVICLNPGTYPTGNFSHGGNSTSPVTLTSANTSNPAIIAGRTVTESGGDYITFSHLKFVWTQQQLDTVVVLGTQHVNFVHNDVNGLDGAICINSASTGGIAYSLIDHNTIHDCKAASGGNPNETQGIYLLGGPGDVISNNWCWAVSGRCYQVRGEQGGSWHNNIADQSGQGWIFGDEAAANNNVYNNIVGNMVGNSVNGPYSAFDYNSSGLGNSFHDNCVSIPPVFDKSANIASSNNTVVSVQFVDAANHNYNLTSAAVNAPCQAYAVQGGNPGP